MTQRLFIPDNYLVLCVLGADKPGMMTEITKTCANSGCNIAECRVAKLGGEFAGTFLLAGNWSSIAKMEATLPNLEQKLGLTTMVRRTSIEEHDPKKQLIPFTLQATAPDRPGIINELSDFFRLQRLNIIEAYSESFAYSSTGTKMVTLNFTILVSAKTHLATLRERLIEFCDDHNFDAVFEPLKS